MNGIISYTASPYRHNQNTVEEVSTPYREERAPQRGGAPLFRERLEDSYRESLTTNNKEEKCGSYRPRDLNLQHLDAVSDAQSDTGSYIHGSHEDVLWSFEQQVQTMSKYGVVANSVEFEELERSLDEELKKYKIYDDKSTKDDTIKTITTENTSVLVQYDGSDSSDSPPPSPDDLLNDTRNSRIDKLYKGYYNNNDNAITPADLHYRAPSDLDYFPTKHTKSPKIYPKSPKPPPKTYGSNTGLRSHHGSSTGLRSHHGSSNGLRSHHGSSSGLASSLGSQGYLNGSSQGYLNGLGADSSNPRFYNDNERHRTRTSSPKLPTTLRHLIDCRDNQAISPPLHQPTRGYASSMPVLDSENIEPNKQLNGVIDSNKMMGARTVSHVSETSRTTNVSLSRQSINKKPSIKSRKGSDNQSAGSSTPSEPDLQDIINILTTSTNLSLVNTAAGALQHLAYNQDHMKTKIREAGAIPVLVHMLSLDDLVCISSLGALRNLSFGRNNHLNRIAIQDAHGITLLVQLLNTTESFEIQELVTGVFWNLSSSDSLKIPILKQALEPIVKNIVITQSGWKEGHTQSTYEQHKYNTSNGSISWTTVFRNATGCLKNLSSAGLDGRSMMRLCPGLVDSLLWTVRSAQGKNDVDNKAVENSVCILRNLSYRLEAEVSPEIKYGEHEDWRSRGLGGGQYRRRTQPDQEKKKRGSKKGKVKEVHVTPLPEHTSGVGLLWQPPVVRIYLDLLLECSNPETLEGAAGALQNLTACSWEPAQTIREMVRKEKGLSVITSLLRLPNDPVVRATAFCLRNLALDIKNKDLLGKNAMHDLVKRLPGGEGVDGITDMTISAIVCALLEVVADSAENCRTCRDCGGIARVVEMARSQDSYSRQCVLTSNRILAIFWEHKDLRKLLKAEGWNISYYARLQSLDRSDGLEYDEPRNQFKTSYTEVPNSSVDRVFKNPEHFVTSPDPTFDSHTMGNGRNHGTPDMLSPGNMMSPGNMTSPLTTVTSPLSQNTSSPQHHPAQYSPNQTTRASTLGRSYDVSNVPSKSYQEISDIPHRGHATLPPRTYNNHVTNHVTNSNNHVNNNYTVADSWV